MAANARDLITLARAYQNLQGVSNIDTLLQTLLTAASDAVQKYCHDKLYAGNGPPPPPRHTRAFSQRNRHLESHQEVLLKLLLAPGPFFSQPDH